MFTGLIEEVGKVKSFTNNELTVICHKILEGSILGDSIAVNGVCLTLTKIISNQLTFHVSPNTATLSRFNASDIRPGELVNLERALTLKTRLGGHLVQGHIDGKAKIITINKKDEDYYFELIYPHQLKAFVVNRGSICLDGISLTISKTLSTSFIVTVIPHTIKDTNLQEKRVGDYMHIEADLFARYTYNILIQGGINYEKNQEIIGKFCIR